MSPASHDRASTVVGAGSDRLRVTKWCVDSQVTSLPPHGRRLRIPIPLAWFLLIATFGTAALLRQFHDGTPNPRSSRRSSAARCSLAIFLLLLVTAREWRRQAVWAGPGMRPGDPDADSDADAADREVVLAHASIRASSSRTRLAPGARAPNFLDTLYRAFAGVGLILVCVVVGCLSRPTMRKDLASCDRPMRWPGRGAGYGARGYRGTLPAGRPRAPARAAICGWSCPEIQPAAVLGRRRSERPGLRRGAVLPRAAVERDGAARAVFGLRSAVGASLDRPAVHVAGLFGLEHLTLGPPWSHPLRELAFAVALGLLFGILVMLSTNLHFVAGVHAWINWLLLGAAPHFVDVTDARRSPREPTSA